MAKEIIIKQQPNFIEIEEEGDPLAFFVGCRNALLLTVPTWIAIILIWSW
ncbi:hypothetical protein [Bacillus sp. FSL R9-9410]